MPSLRCSICAINWPVLEDYDECPQCGEETSRVGNIKAIPEEEAWDMKVHFDFERFYEEWDAQQPPERLEPDRVEVEPQTV